MFNTMTSEKSARKTPKPPPKSFYLGDRELADKRVEKLEQIAHQFGLTRSTLLQAIADGQLIVIKSDEKS